MLTRGNHVFRELVNHRYKARIKNLAIAHTTRIFQLLPEDPRWRIIRLGGKPDHKTFRPRGQTTRCLTKHIFCIGNLAKQPRLIDQHPNGFLAANRIRIRRDYLQATPHLAVSNRLDMGLHMHERIELIIFLNHISRRCKTVIRNLNRRCQNDELSRVSPVPDQRS